MACAGEQSIHAGTPAAGRVVGLFAGIGGIEHGLHLAGFHTEMMCEIDTAAQRVLAHNFPGIPVIKDVRELRTLPKAEIVTAGFPCQDLSQAGKTAGIRGRHSGLVAEVFRLLAKPPRPRWLFFENVPFMLQLQRGRAMRFLIECLEELGYSWAYRIVDARAFGLPQRRQRVLLLASRTEDPRTVLFQGNEVEFTPQNPEKVACGFYWTEGLKGLGWAVDAVPTLKGGSTVGIPSPPAIRMPRDRMIVTPEIRDAERLQGFAADWTLPATDGDTRRNGPRWRLVGNAVSVTVSKWFGERLRAPIPYDDSNDLTLAHDSRWPCAAWGRSGKVYRSNLSLWPAKYEYQHLDEFLLYPTAPLSERATAGFLSRMDASTSLRFPKGFRSDIAAHRRRMRGTKKA
jgi:DNA (cytosine-5)-methyltransferase 1